MLLGLRGKKMIPYDPYDKAIDEILKGAQGDARLALRTVLMQNVQLEAQVLALSARLSRQEKPSRREELH